MGDHCSTPHQPGVVCDATYSAYGLTPARGGRAEASPVCRRLRPPHSPVRRQPAVRRRDTTGVPGCARCPYTSLPSARLPMPISASTCCPFAWLQTKSTAPVFGTPALSMTCFPDLRPDGIRPGLRVIGPEVIIAADHKFSKVQQPFLASGSSTLNVPLIMPLPPRSPSPPCCRFRACTAAPAAQPSVLWNHIPWRLLCHTYPPLCGQN